MRLESVVNQHAGAVSRLRRSFMLASTDSFSKRDRETAYVCIEAMNYWSLFCRKTIECAMNSGTLGGNLIGWNVVPGDWCRIACLTHQKSPSGIRRDEPKWYVPANLVKTSAQLDFGIHSNILAAVSSNTRVLHDLPCVRNSYAHRNETTKRSAAGLYVTNGVPYRAHPTDMLCTRQSNGYLLLEEWLYDLEGVIRLFI